MGFKLINATDKSILHSEDNSENDFNRRLRTNTFSHSLLNGLMEGREWIFNGIRVLYTNAKFNEPSEFDWKGDYEIVSMLFNLRGKMSLYSKDTNSIFEMNNNEHNIFFGSNAEGQLKTDSLHMRSFTIQFTREAFLDITNEGNEALKRFAEQVALGKTTAFSPGNLNISLEMSGCINAMLDCRFSDSLKELFLLSKSIELLVLQAESFNKPMNQKQVFLKRSEDKDRIFFARDYLLQNLTTPPSLTDLAKIAGVNEFKLKKGFKELFGTTTFGYLAEVRMDLAKKALQEKQKSVSEIAFELGYSSPQHFASAFKKKFGMSPKQVKTE